MEVACQCRSITFPAPAAKPIALYHCHCLECRAQSASAFGTSAIFPASPLFPLSDELRAKLKVWTRPAAAGATMNCYFCPECGVRIMHHDTMKDGSSGEVVSIKGGVVQGLDWSGAAHIWCKRAVVAIPEGVERWEGEPDD